MNIFISSDDNFILPTKVMLTSFFVNNRNEAHSIYFLYSSVSTQNLNDLRTLIESRGSCFHPVLIQEDDFHGFHCKNGYPLLVYYRLLVAQILPESEDRALWMDVDLIVNGPIDEFYYQSFDGYCLAACRDCDSPTRMKQLTDVPDAIYVNAGVVLFNAKALRGITLEDFYSYYQAHEEHILLQDQDILNGMFAGKIKVWANNSYNFFAPSQRMTKATSLHQVKNNRVIHYIGKHKPWKNSYAHPAGSIWDDYYLLTFPKSKLSSRMYRVTRCCIRWFQGTFIFPMRLFHGMIYEYFVAGRR